MPLNKLCQIGREKSLIIINKVKNDGTFVIARLKRILEPDFLSFSFQRKAEVQLFSVRKIALTSMQQVVLPKRYYEYFQLLPRGMATLY